MVGTIKIVCDKCGTSVDTPRTEYDPPEAVELRGTDCPDCDSGGFDLPSYYDANGQQVDGNPDRFQHA